jgi:hypothetical protein
MKPFHFPILFYFLLLPMTQAAFSYPSCGLYVGKGKLRTDSSGLNLLQVRAGTSEHFDIVLHGLTVNDTTGYEKKMIQLELQIYHSERGTIRAHALSHPMLAHLDSPSDDGLILMNKVKCEN